MGARRLVPPTLEPVTLAEAKAHLRYVPADQDALILERVAVARDVVERYCERALLTQEWELQLAYPVPAWQGVPAGGEVTDSHLDWFVRNRLAVRTDSAAAGGIGVALPWAAPLQTVVEVTLDEVVLAPEAWTVDPTLEPAVLSLVDAAAAGWLTVRYTCGATVATAVPGALRQSVYALLGTYFRFRGDEIEPEPEATSLPLGVQVILDPYRLGSLV
jgi:hypothetical protein